jgi:hypothetical protein
MLEIQEDQAFEGDLEIQKKMYNGKIVTISEWEKIMDAEKRLIMSLDRFSKDRLQLGFSAIIGSLFGIGVLGWNEDGIFLNIVFIFSWVLLFVGIWVFSEGWKLKKEKTWRIKEGRKNGNWNEKEGSCR